MSKNSEISSGGSGFKIFVSIIGACILIFGLGLWGYKSNLPHECKFENRRVIVREPTCDVEGLAERYCECGEKTTESIPTTSHLLETTYMETPPTCTKPGCTTGVRCWVCNTIFSGFEEIPPLGHKPVYVDGTDPDCLNPGYGPHERCAECGEDLTSASITAPPLGHSEATRYGYPATCGSPGLSDGTFCTRCTEDIVPQVEIPTTEHKNLVYSMGFSPTKDTDGRTSATICFDCGNTISGGEILHATGSAGLEFKQNYNSYVLVGIGTCTDSVIYIPEYHNDLPVLGIGSSAFMGCTNITEIKILGNNLQTIGGNAFTDCEKLRSISIPESVYEIGDSAFSNCRELTSVTLPSSLTRIGSFLFGWCYSLTYVNIPGGVVDIGEAAFWYTNLAEANLPGGLQRIGNYAFACTSLTYLNIPYTVQNIENASFYGCQNLQTISVDHRNPIYQGDGTYLYDVNESNLIWVSIVSGGNYIVPEGIKIIGSCAFYDSKFSEILLPESLERIESEAFSCCTRIKKMYIPDSVSYIADYAFNSCTNLSTVYLPASLTSFNCYSFDNCPKLKNIEVSPWNSRLAFDGTYLYLTQNNTIVYTTLDRNITELTIPSDFNFIGEGVFANFYDLKKVVLPSSIEGIKSYAFDCCSQLSSVIIPVSVYMIDPYAFSNCLNLSEVTYRGTKKDWNNIPMLSVAWTGDRSITVKCTDGSIYIQGAIY